MRSGRRLAVLVPVLGIMGFGGAAEADACDALPAARSGLSIAFNDGRCGTVAHLTTDDRGRSVAGQCSYVTSGSGELLTVTLVGESTAARALPSDEDPAGRLVPVALTTRCIVRSVSGPVVLDVLSGSIGLVADAQFSATTAASSLAPFVVCVEASAVYGDFDAVWTPLDCADPT